MPQNKKVDINWDILFNKWWDNNAEDDGEEISLDFEVMMDENLAGLSEEQFQNCLTEIHESLSITAREDNTLVFLVIKDTLGERNVSTRISCNRGYSLSGYARVKDNAEDCYLIDCVEYIQLGYIPVVFELAVDKSSGWKTIIPIPDKLIEKFLEPYFKRQIKLMKKKYSRPRFEFHYIQMLDCR